MTPTPELRYGVDDIPPLGVSLALGLQHYFMMVGATIAIPLILADGLGITDPVEKGWLIGTILFVSGIATLIQTTIGNRLPIVQGGTFSLLTPALAIAGMDALADVGWQVRMQHVQGAIIMGAVVEIVVGYTGLVGRLIRYLGPITIAPTIGLIGLSLFKVGAPNAGSHWWIGGLAIALIIVFSQYLHRVSRFFELFPVLLGMGIAWGVAAIATAAGIFPAGHPAYVSTQVIQDSAWIRVPMPFQWGLPTFGAAALVGMLAGYFASMIESVGDYYACARLAGAPLPTRKTIDRGIGAEGLGCLVAGIFGTGNGSTSYSENIGAIGLTRVGSRRVVQAGAVLMILFGVLGKFGAIFASIPQPVTGAMYCVMFGMIVAVGLSNLQHVDLNASRNLFIIGFAFFMGMSMPEYFAANPIDMTGMSGLKRGLAEVVSTLGQTGMAVGALIAVFLDNTIPGTDEQRGLVAWATAEQNVDPDLAVP